MQTAKNNTKKDNKKWWIAIGVVVFFIVVVSAIGGTAEDAQQVTVIDSSQEIIVDVPAMLGMTKTEAEEVLGMAVSHENIDDMDWETDQYYLSSNLTDGKISTLFFSYDKTDAPAETIMAAGNIDPYSSNYVIKIQQWLNPDLAKSDGASQVSGIHVCLNKQDTSCN